MPSSNELSHWSLKDLLPDPVDQAVEAELKKLEGAVSELEAMRPSMTAQIPQESFAKVLATLDTIKTRMRRLQAYAALWFSEDTQNEAALNLRDRLDRALVGLGNRTLFFDIWFKDLPGEAAARLITSSGDMRYALEFHPAFQTIHFERSGGKTAQPEGCEWDQCTGQPVRNDHQRIHLHAEDGQ